MDVLFEENETFLQKDYSGTNIFEWNINGCTDHQIHTMVHWMMMFATVCQHNGNTDRNTSFLVILLAFFKVGGITNFSEENKYEILNALKQENN